MYCINQCHTVPHRLTFSAASRAVNRIGPIAVKHKAQTVTAPHRIHILSRIPEVHKHALTFITVDIRLLLHKQLPVSAVVYYFGNAQHQPDACIAVVYFAQIPLRRAIGHIPLFQISVFTLPPEYLLGCRCRKMPANPRQRTPPLCPTQ